MRFKPISLHNLLREVVRSKPISLHNLLCEVVGFEPISLHNWLLPSSCEFLSLKNREPHLTGCYHHHHVLSSLFVITCFDVFLRLKMFILCSLQHNNCNPNNSYHLVDILSTDCSSLRSMHGTFPTTFPFTFFLQILVYNLTVSCGPHFGSECVYLLRCTIQNASRHFDFQVPSFRHVFWTLKLTAKPSKTFFLSDLKVLDVHAQCKHCASSELTSTFFACYFVFQLIGQKRDIISNGYKTHSQ